MGLIIYQWSNSIQKYIVMLFENKNHLDRNKKPKTTVFISRSTFSADGYRYYKAGRVETHFQRL